MPQSPNERITVIERIVDTHIYRLDASAKEVDAVYDAHRELEKEHADLKRTTEREIALLQREIDELKRWKEDVKKREEEWGRKLWMILPPVLAVLVSNAITYLLTVYGKK
jgi:chromosome segregation ATPase